MGMLVIILLGIIGTLLVGMKSQKRRVWGLLFFLCANVGWMFYGAVQKDWYIFIQFACYMVVVVIGLVNNRDVLRRDILK